MPPNIQNKLKESKITFTIFVASLFGFPHFENIMYVQKRTLLATNVFAPTPSGVKS